MTMVYSKALTSCCRAVVTTMDLLTVLHLSEPTWEAEDGVVASATSIAKLVSW